MGRQFSYREKSLYERQNQSVHCQAGLPVWLTELLSSVAIDSSLFRRYHAMQCMAERTAEASEKEGGFMRGLTRKVLGAACAVLIVAFMVLMGSMTPSAARFGAGKPYERQVHNPKPSPFLILAATKKPAGRKAQCKALNKCRGHFTYCDEKVFRAKPSAKRDAAHEACVAKYRTCIKKNFSSGEMFFTRWFVPGECKP